MAFDTIEEIYERVFEKHESCPWFEKFRYTDCKTQILNEILMVLAEVEMETEDNNPGLNKECIDDFGHRFEKLVDERDQKYFDTKENKVRDHFVSKTEYMVCKRCGVDSRVLNNPVITISKPEIKEG